MVLMVVFSAMFVSLALFFSLYGVNISMKSRSSCVSCVNAVRMIVRQACFTVFAVLNFDIRCSVGSTELDEHERKVSFQ